MTMHCRKRKYDTSSESDFYLFVILMCTSIAEKRMEVEVSRCPENGGGILVMGNLEPFYRQN